MARRLTFTKPAAHLLSLVSGVKEESIQNMYVYERGMSHPYPWYSNDSYGGITLPHGNTYETIYTNNLFDDDDLGKIFMIGSLLQVMRSGILMQVTKLLMRLIRIR